MEEHRSVTKSLPVELTGDAAERVFAHMLPLIDDRITEDDPIPRDYQDALKKIDTFFKGDRLEAAFDESARASLNRSNIELFLERDIFAGRDLVDFDIRGVPDLVGVFGRADAPSDIYRQLFLIKAKISFSYALKYTINNDSVRKQARIDAFDQAGQAFLTDLTFSPHRLESWYCFALCRLGVMSEKLSWSASRIVSDFSDILLMQRQAFWALKMCLHLLNSEKSSQC
jgi:hypothetical protein